MKLFTTRTKPQHIGTPSGEKPGEMTSTYCGLIVIAKRFETTLSDLDKPELCSRCLDALNLLRAAVKFLEAKNDDL